MSATIRVSTSGPGTFSTFSAGADLVEGMEALVVLDAVIALVENSS